MIKWFLTKWYKHSPDCICGYRMKPIDTYGDTYSWTCIWKQCEWEVFESDNGKLHWWKKRV